MIHFGAFVAVAVALGLVVAILAGVLKMIGWTLKLTLGFILLPVLVVTAFAVLFGLGVAAVAVVGVALGLALFFAVPVLALGGLTLLVVRGARS